MGKKTTVIFMLAVALAIYPVTALAKDKTDLDVSGTFTGEDVHYSATETEFIFNGEVHIKNESDDDIEGLLLMLDYPDGSEPTYFDENPIKLDTIPAGKTLDKELTINMFGNTDISSDPMLRAHVGVFKEDDLNEVTEIGAEVAKVVDLDGEIDLSVMKSQNAEVNAEIAGQVKQNDDGDYVLDITVEGTNDSIYDIKQEEEIYVGFELPYDIELDTEKAPKGVHQTTAGKLTAVQIDVPAGESFQTEYALPLKGEFEPKMMNDLNDKITLFKRKPGSTREFYQAGVADGNTDLDFSVMGEEEKSESEAEMAEKESEEGTAVASSTTDDGSSGEYTFFDIPFFVGALGGIVISMFFFVILNGRKKA